MDPSWKTSRGRQVQSFWELISVVGVIQEMAWVTDTSTVYVIHLLKKYTGRHNSLTLFFGLICTLVTCSLFPISYFHFEAQQYRAKWKKYINKLSVSLCILHSGLKFRGKPLSDITHRGTVHPKMKYSSFVFCRRRKKSYRFGWGWVNNNRNGIFEWTIPLISKKEKKQQQSENLHCYGFEIYH